MPRSMGDELPDRGGDLNMYLAADKGDITTIIGGIAPNWGPFGSLGNEARIMGDRGIRLVEVRRARVDEGDLLPLDGPARVDDAVHAP